MKLRLLECFGGIGACSKALEKLGIDYEIVDYVEIDKYAVKSYNAIHGTNFEPQDITKWDKDIKVDLLMHGSPCFLAGELVNTTKGLIPIENVKVGDKVISHDGTVNEVIETMVNKNNWLFDITCGASHKINTTFNHPFYVFRNGKHEWINACDLKTDDYLCIPINKNQDDINWNGTTLNYNNHNTLVNNLPFEDLRFWYMIGRFIGDGWVIHRKQRNNNISGICICCAKYELDDLKEKLGDVLHYSINEEKTTYRLFFSNKELGEFCSQFGIGAKNKFIPTDILNINVKYLKSLLDGIVDSDGSYIDGKYKVTTISKKLAYSLGELVLKVNNVPYHIYKTLRPKQQIICGREVNQNNTYQIVWKLDNYDKKINFVDDKYLYTRVRKIESRKELQDVYNIEVKNTHSYCVNNIAVHNCQDFSLAGLQRGGTKIVVLDHH